MSHLPASPGPPRWLQRLIQRLTAPHLQEMVLGDLEERFHQRLQRQGLTRARYHYLLDCLLLLHPRLWRAALPPTPAPGYHSPYTQPFFLHYAMLHHYLTIAWRNLRKNTAFSLINILGLSLGMLCCLLIGLWVEDEQSIDRFHDQEESLYTAYQTITTNGRVEGNYTTPIRVVDRSISFLLEDVPKAVPEVQRVAFYATGYDLPWGHPETFQAGEKTLKLAGSRASRNFLTMLNYPLLAGHAETALSDIHSIAISRKMANLFFNDPRQAVGKTFRYENKLDFMVTAVFEDLPPQSSLSFDFLLNWEAQKKGVVEWSSNDFRTFIQLTDQADRQLVEAKINRFLRPQLPRSQGSRTRVGLQPLGEQYLHGTFIDGKPQGGRIEYVRVFTGVALFLLLIACINFMNLATARSVKRAKEVGVRKVLGSTRAYLMGQFFGEAFLLALLAMLVTLLLVVGLLPAFNAFTGKQIGFPLAKGSFWAWLLSVLLLTGLLAGSYPALFLSSLQPVRVLKGVLRFTRQANWFRQGLTVFQFGLAILLVIVALVVAKQTDYVQHTHLGYDRENLIYIRIEGALALPRTYARFKEQASQLSAVALVDRSSEAPHAMGFVVDDNDGVAETAAGEAAINWEGKEKTASVGFKPTSVGFDFVRLMHLTLVEGRDFSRAIATDSADAFMVNQEAVRQMGLKNPVGKWVSAWQKKGRIIGILKDYHTHSLREPIKPVIVDVKENENFGVVLIRTQPGKTREALSGLEQVYRQINPNYPFAYQFLDQEYGKLYRNEQVVTRLSNLFAGLAIGLSCLGLLGLVMFSAEQRTKEIAIRKVLGATATSVLALLTQTFLKLVVLAAVLASPLAWYVVHRWLQSFAYRTDVPWWIFATAGLGALVVTLATVSFQSVKAALANPVKSLRAE